MTWGKLEIDPVTRQVISSLPLVDHCIDVANVFRALCVLAGIRRNLDEEAGCELSDTHLDRLAVFALLHDLGKCNRGFQAKNDPQAKEAAGHVREVAALLFDADLRDRMCTSLGLEDMAAWFCEPDADLLRMILAAVSHHGEPAFNFDSMDSIAVERAMKWWQPAASYDPFTAMAQLGRAARAAFPDAFAPAAEPLVLTPALAHRFAGLLMLADWLGSHKESFFPFHHPGDRIAWARQQARTALVKVGLDVGSARQCLADGLPSFGAVFGLEADAKPLQQALAHADLPPLVIAESDTGSGKTEAAILHFLALFATGKVDGLYFALPTRVAARELYGRVRAAMHRVFGEACPPVLLAVPGYAQVDGEPASLLPDPARLWHEADRARHERAWAAERPKRFLAAAVAVGTIDQALFSVIQVPHAHLRGACLDRSLLVIDEVHSSDVYMRYLSRKMLARHLKAGGRALLLSATLGSSARAEYLSPEQRLVATEDFEIAARQPYPAICSPGVSLRHLPDPRARPKRVQIMSSPLLEDPEGLLPALRGAIETGQRVMVVLNTVARAVRLARAADADPILRSALFSVNGQGCPHHGRFARPDRERLDQEVSRRMGKHSPDGPILLIGTQTLEQSLDIDADWLVSDLCPMDVLLQRIGRLHRHDRGPRPMAECTVLLPAASDFSAFLKPNGERGRGVPAGLGSVYEDLRILQLTRDWAATQPQIELPRDNRSLVEAATHPACLATLAGPKWQAHGGRLEGVGQAQAVAAHQAVIPLEHFGEFLFPARTDARLATRLGLNDRTLALGGQHVSPFGHDITEINLPGYLAPGLVAEQAQRVCQQPDVLDIQVDGLTLRYTRFGLEKVDEPAA